MACSLLRLGTHWAWFIVWLKTISPHQVHITLHCYFESCLKGQRKRDVDYMHSLQWQHIPVSSQNLRSLEENSHSLFCSMVLKYESQHLPYKSTSYVGKYTIHGAYGTVPSTFPQWLKLKAICMGKSTTHQPKLGATWRQTATTCRGDFGFFCLSLMAKTEQTVVIQYSII